MSAIYADANATLKDLQGMFEDTVQQTRPSLVPRLCTTKDSDGAYEKYAFPTAVAQPRPWNDQRVPTGVDVNAVYQIDNQLYELTLDFKGELLMDARAYSMEEIVREAAMSAVLYPDFLLSSLIAGGLAGTALAFDGNPFYGDTHLYAKSGSNNIDNKLAGSGTAVTNLRTDFQAALAALRGWKDNAGRLINQQAAEGANNLVVQCPLGMEYDFRQVLNSAWYPITSQASGDNIFKGVADVVGDGYLTDANDWYLHYVGMPMRPFIMQEREKLQTDVLGFGSEWFKNTGTVRILARQRFRLGYFAFYRSLVTVN